MELQITDHHVAVVGAAIDAFATIASQQTPIVDLRGAPFILELISEAELHDLQRDRGPALKRACANIDLQHVLPLGVGGNDNVYHLVVIWNPGQLVRKRLGLPPRHFYIQLSTRDVDDLIFDRSPASLLPEQQPATHSIELLDHLIYTLIMHDDITTARRHAITACSQYPESEKGFLRLADLGFTGEEWKLAMLAYGQALSLADSGSKLASYCVKRIQACSQHTEVGAVFLDSERSCIPAELRTLLLRPWPGHARDTLSTIYESELPTLCRDSTERPFIPVPSPSHSLPEDSSWSRLPRFFRWVVPFAFAVMSTPRDFDDITLLAHPLIGIKHIVTLTEESPLDKAWFARLGGRVKHTFISVPNYQPPSIEQMDLILRICAEEENAPVLVHCGGGKGRAGTIAACYLAAFGFAPAHLNAYRETPAMESGAAISALRAIRPGSLETSQQETFVQRYVSGIWKRQSVLPEPVSETSPCAMDVIGDIPSPDELDMLLLVGLPGSGKSWFAHSLCKRDPDKWNLVSQDEIGGRAGVESVVGRSSAMRKTLILDRCNSSVEDRKWFMKLADTRSVPLRAVCVWFDYTADLCTWRAQNRPEHPTLPPGGRVRAAVRQMQETQVKPTLEEGFAAIITLRSFAAADELIRVLSLPVNLLKFPRTSHLINLGAATEDDIIWSLPTLTTRTSDSEVNITEKVDGANMGFSLSSDGQTILTQNRSHYVNTASHEQFRRLGNWVDRHRDTLVRILGRDKQFPERYVLYGEWLAATHSISYARLPALFMAFDLYDRSTKAFVDRNRLEIFLLDSGIPLTPILYRGSTTPDEQRLVEMASEPSLFYDGPREGVYVKWEKGGRVVERSKIVRAGFIAGNEHWTKGIIRFNGIVDHDT